MDGFSEADTVEETQAIGYGYRLGEVTLPGMSNWTVELDIKTGSSISEPRPTDPMNRPPVLVSLGMHVPGVALPHVDPSDPLTTVAGVRKRFAIKMPPFDPTVMNRFSLFVKEWIETNMVPLPADSDVSVATWIESTQYPRSRKDDLLRTWRSIGEGAFWKSQYNNVKSFVKDEVYPSYKHARAINSRSDEFKCKVGPFFKLIEKELFKKEYFIKKIPIRDRPKYINDMLYRVGAKYMATDFTAFESTFVAELMEACEMQLYYYMTQHLPTKSVFYECLDVIKGINVCEFKHFTVKVPATRMSGEMNTSLGNGFSNLMMLLFVMKEIGEDPSQVRAVIEGDDCLCVANNYPTADDYKLLGANIKIEIHESISTASFCGLVYDPIDLNNVSDPLEAVATLGWTTGKYLRASTRTKRMLLRCKALSYAHQYPGCPIIQSLAKNILRLTSGIDVRHYVVENRNLSEWERSQLLQVLDFGVKNLDFPEPGIRTRLLVADLFKIGLSEQKFIEDYFDSLTEIGPLKLNFLRMIMPVEWTDYASKYVRDPRHVANLEFPVEHFPIINSDRSQKLWTSPMIRYSVR